MPFLFSYGTLQQEAVQLSTFGRRLAGTPDTLIGFLISQVRITTPEVIAMSGKEFHPIAKATGCLDHRIPGTVFELTEAELADADRYEVDAYRRVATTLESGRVAWVYVEAIWEEGSQ